ncbi:DNA/RNA non-specific endonuclease [Bifidobacterium simiarum]|uniref:DNA/RNA non-specific endonuclease n=1 Tax=Bifidobacterium simiarum TaxID=2045441 RepID=UPI001BDCF3FA|nr:DNA/RNA non-specific endonuclease [Bifidobacterium simiarum]MBT1166287.1 DNA/RNA non-specific endonuclease [Bifidobacterium simiarum]
MIPRTLTRATAAFAVVLAMLAPLAGCTVEIDTGDDSSSSSSSASASSSPSESSSSAGSSSGSSSSGSSGSTGSPSDSSTNGSTSGSSGTASDTAAWNPATAPNYYLVSGRANFSAAGSLPATGTIRYAEPDSLDRSGMAVGVIDRRLMTAGSSRERHMPDTITGWPRHNPKVAITMASGRTYHGYLFNKSHLIAKSLGGKDEADNMVTGTRTQNVGDNDATPGGMAYTETLARNWLKTHSSGTIVYMATPHYQGSELLPRTVTVDIRTSDGSIDQHVIVYNTAQGYDIDYANGGTR